MYPCSRLRVRLQLPWFFVANNLSPGGEMGQARLPHNCALFQEGGVWILRTNEDLIGSVDGERGSWRNLARIGIATGPEALTERDAQHLARRYLLSQLPPGSEAQRSQQTVAE